MKFIKTAALVSAFIYITPITSSANLGESLSKAQAREASYGNKYGAADPLFKADGNGNVIWECWAAPPNMWSESEVLAFARVLLPKSIRNKIPNNSTKDGSYITYSLPDGTQIITTGFGGRFDGVEVRSPGYSGGNC